MGNFYGQDLATGDPIHAGDPVVAFVVSPGKGYPFEENAAQSTLAPTGRFLLESLPLHGVYDGAFGLEISRENDLAVRLLLKTTGATDWEDFLARGLKVNASSQGLRIFGDAEPVDAKYAGADRQRVYGLAMMHAETFVHLLSQPMLDEHGETTTARRELDKMLALQARYASVDTTASAPGETFTDAQMEKIQLDQACGMGKQFSLQNETGEIVRAPKLCQALDYDVYGGDFLASTRFFALATFHRPDDQRSKSAGAMHIKGEAWPREDAREFLSQLWTVQATLDALKRVVAEVRPMFGVTEGAAEEPIRALRLHAIEKDLLRQFVRMVRDDEREPEEAMNFIDQSLAKVDETVSRTKTLARAHLARTTLEALPSGPRP